MRELIIFAAGASLAATIFFVAVIELIFTIKRRKINQKLQEHMKTLKVNYNQTVNKLVQEEEQKLQAADKTTEEVTARATEEKKKVEEAAKAEIEEVKEDAEKEVAQAKAHAKKLKEQAEMKAEEYLESRKEQVEQELMTLVMSVTKKVLPEGLTYEAQKEMVMTALKDAKTGTGKRNAK